jgi:putative endonuclease
MDFFVYVLFSPGFQRTYAGQTDDVSKRLKMHNAGRVRSTKAYRAWVLIHQERFGSRSEAMRREKWLKSRSGRKFIAQLVAAWKKGEGFPL